MTLFTENDLQQLSKKGISQDKVKSQIGIFEEGIPNVILEKAAIVNDGVSRFTAEKEDDLIQKYEAAKDSLSVIKFVPASGAASRMFKVLFNFLDTFNPKSESLQNYLERTGNSDIKTFFEEQKKLPFFEIVQGRIRGKCSSTDEEAYLFVNEMLMETGLNYGFLPKGLLPFHKYDDIVVTPFEEHLKEAAQYAKVSKDAKLHFTISEQHGELFNEEFKNIKERVANATNTAYHVQYSFQKSATDTLAVTMDNEIFRNEDGTILFRPGGHGALIENLNEQDADIIFIKNIDNVVVSEFSEEVAQSKKILAGLLLALQDKAFKFAKILDSGDINVTQLQKINDFLQKELNVRFTDTFSNFGITQQIEVLKDKLNRPIRICGMVKNEGEPGGGPFWIRDSKGNISLQIIESAQVNLSNESQVEIFNKSTHFNPVDLVCGVKNYKGNKYSLLNFVDTKQGFITNKTSEGRNLKALELPGLWNGAMAFWNTVFVEVPSITFNPVKTVNDLLKSEHQVSN